MTKFEVLLTRIVGHRPFGVFHFFFQGRDPARLFEILEEAWISLPFWPGGNGASKTASAIPAKTWTIPPRDAASFGVEGLNQMLVHFY